MASKGCGLSLQWSRRDRCDVGPAASRPRVVVVLLFCCFIIIKNMSGFNFRCLGCCWFCLVRSSVFQKRPVEFWKTGLFLVCRTNLLKLFSITSSLWYYTNHGRIQNSKGRGWIHRFWFTLDTWWQTVLFSITRFVHLFCKQFWICWQLTNFITSTV